MITMSKESAFDWLWGTTLINLGLGALLWVINTVALDNNDFDWSSDQVNSLLWHGIGSGFRATKKTFETRVSLKAI
jgi:hypothetical protein